MRVTIEGTGCVTPLGATVGEVWQAIESGKRVAASPLSNPETGRNYLNAPVPSALTACVSRESRLRRSSAVSLLGAAAAKQAIESSAIHLAAHGRDRLAVVFAVSSGGVQYTRRFYEQVVKQGANAASPMLFPETVYNAPASHVAALLGVDGATYTLVGDGTIGLQATSFAAQLLHLGDAEKVLVVASEELDWILLEAHCDWRLASDGHRTGALLAEGAAAAVFSLGDGPLTLETNAGCSFVNRKEAGAAMASVLSATAPAGVIDLIISGTNGTWTDRIIEKEVSQLPGARDARIVAPKLHLGEALGAGGLLQVVLGAAGLEATGGKRALIASLGWNQQAAAALVERDSARAD